MCLTLLLHTHSLSLHSKGWEFFEITVYSAPRTGEGRGSKELSTTGLMLFITVDLCICYPVYRLRMFTAVPLGLNTKKP